MGSLHLVTIRESRVTICLGWAKGTSQGEHGTTLVNEVLLMTLQTSRRVEFYGLR